MKIVFAASEMFPFIKTGGLGDVIDSLSKALSLKNEVYVFLPFYKNEFLNLNNALNNNGNLNFTPNNNLNDNLNFSKKNTNQNNSSEPLSFLNSFFTFLSWRKEHIGVFKINNNAFNINPEFNLNIFLIDNEHYFKRANIYGENDDCERFCFFSKAVLETLVKLNICPDIIHCHDWQTSAIPSFLNVFYKIFFKNTKTVLTIHNIEYQGKADISFLEDVLGLGKNYLNTFLFNACINLLKGGILTANFVTTVSKTYAYELEYPYFAEGLEKIINAHKFKFKGITNGINTNVFNPKTDKNIYCNYGSEDFFTKKANNKTELQKALGLSVNKNVPLIAMVTRLVDHKGISLVKEKIFDILNLNVQFVLLGTGDKYYEDFFKNINTCNNFNAYNGYENDFGKNTSKYSCNIKFDNSLAHKIYAASDIYLMPSKSEPCGLSQLIAMRYGSVPVVNKIGGLNDTVKAFNIKTLTGTGFTFQTFNSGDMFNALLRAVDLYFNNRNIFNCIVKNCLIKESSFLKAAKEYEKLYKSIL